ncbi:transposase [Brevibacillus sp. 179-C9.3 HS]
MIWSLKRQQKSRISSGLRRHQERILLDDYYTLNLLANLFENAITSFVKENLESIIRAEIKHYMEEEPGGEHNSRNGYYKRSLNTKYGHIEDLQVPRDRNGSSRLTSLSRISGGAAGWRKLSFKCTKAAWATLRCPLYREHVRQPIVPLHHQ